MAALHVPTDWRNIVHGTEIPTETYSDQPKIVKADDGAWVCCLTTGSGREGATGQHIIVCRSVDQGRSWSEPVAVEPPDGPEASYAALLKAEGGRMYCFYNHNTDEIREVKVDTFGTKEVTESGYPDGYCRRVDSLGHFVYKLSDDHGRTWSRERYEIPIRETEIDRTNVYGGAVRFFWNVSRPFTHAGSAYVPLHKVGGFGPGFFVRNEGVLLESNNLLTETDPTRIRWTTLPDGDVGLRAPDGGGPISSEHSFVVLSDGSFYSIYRTVDGYPACAYSRDGGHTWSQPQYATFADGRRIKNPRAANFAWRCENGRYLYWFHNHGGPVVRARGARDPAYPYQHRNPVWLSAGTEADGPDGRILLWSEPEVVLYDDDPLVRMSYPDLVEEDGRYYLAETQKDTARVHLVNPAFVETLLAQQSADSVTREGLVLELPGAQRGNADAVPMPELPRFVVRDADRPDYGSKHLRGGFTLDLWINIGTCGPGTLMVSNRTHDGCGVRLETTHDRGLELILSDGRTENRLRSDPGVLSMSGAHHVVVIVDAGPNVMFFVIDGRVNDGAEERQFGWKRFSPHLESPNGGEHLQVGTHVRALRLYNRALMVSEAVGNFRAGG
jgi:hypothetical protein